ncbi:MAG TPA: zf-HC2 domain-containing protein [Ktedonobacterales bacterium]|nr:zf-HC2 domain-containing protein [Ktedonobacterales bacterium]
MSATTTHAWLRRVSDYHSGNVSATERAAVEAHLADCAECRLALAAYRRLYTLARSPLRLGDGGEGPLMDYQPMMLEETMLTTDRDVRGAPPWRRPPTRLTALGAIAAVLLIAILAAALFTHFRAPTQPATLPSGLDAPTRAYVNLLRTSYVPLVNANAPVLTCVAVTATADPSARAALMASCRAPLQTELSVARTFVAQIATSAPPAGLRPADTALKQAAPQLVTFLSGELADIDMQSVSDFVASEDPGSMATYAFVPPIQAVNAVIYAGKSSQVAALPLMGYVYPR